MKPILVEKKEHRGLTRYFLYYEMDFSYNELVRQIRGARFSGSNKAWHVPATKESEAKLRELFGEKLKKKPEQRLPLPPQAQLKEANELHLEKTEAFKKWLRSRRYSELTIVTYTDSLLIFFRFLHDKKIEDITNEDVVNFNNEYILKHKLSSSYQNQVVNAVKLFFRSIENKKLDLDLIHRPRRAKTLPNVLSKEEVRKIIYAPVNIKHRTMLSLIYSCGLRRSELLQLKITDIDFNRGLVIIKMAKGRKDRIAPLSEKIALMIRDYVSTFSPKVWLFEGQSDDGRYDERSLANVLKTAVQKAGISKPVSLHWLRHSYATHLLENGTDLRYIQEILGHKSSRTTEIYTHVSNKSIQRIVSPFDNL